MVIIHLEQPVSAVLKTLVLFHLLKKRLVLWSDISMHMHRQYSLRYSAP